MCSSCYNCLRIFVVAAALSFLLEHYQRYYSRCRSPFASSATTNETEPALPCAPPHIWITTVVQFLDYTLYLFVVAHVLLVYVLALTFSLPCKQPTNVEGRFAKPRCGKTRKANGRRRSTRCGSEVQTAGDISSS